MKKVKFTYLLILSINLMISTYAAKKEKSLVVNNISDMKEFKKILRTKTNVLVLFLSTPKESSHILNVFKDVSSKVKGIGTLVQIDCNNSESKKICKKYKINLLLPYKLKHFKDGEFHKDYDRREAAQSMINFLQDPTGDLPWEEDPTAVSVIHLADANALTKFLKKGAGTSTNSLIMFYAPWCGYCKTLKPHFSKAADELATKVNLILAAMDVSKSGNSKVRQQFNITGFPTLLYFERGQLKYPYSGENNKDALVQFMLNPSPQPVVKNVEDESWSKDSDVLHLTDDTFDDILKNAEHLLVVFYAPWCGHCKKIKPEFEKAATMLKNAGNKGLLAAVDATKEKTLAGKYNLKGYPTLIYFKGGEKQFEAGHLRESDKIVEFMMDPKEPPPPPPPEIPWSEQVSNVLHLNSTNFRKMLKRAKHALVMFYAPWCGHCKSAKPEVMKAADEFADELGITIAAVDCTVEKDLCSKYDVKGFPTFKYFSYYDKVQKDYNGARKGPDFVKFLKDEIKAGDSEPTDSQTSGFGSNVIILNDNNFKEYIMDSRPTFIMFYASWCGHCVSVKPAYSRAATALVTENSPLRFCAIDCGKNTFAADIAEIESYPTFKLYKGGEFLADYNGDRSANDMIHFAKKTSGLPIKTEL